MPSLLFPNRRPSSAYTPHRDGLRPPRGHDDEDEPQVHINARVEEEAAQLHRSVTEGSITSAKTENDSPFSNFEQYIRDNNKPPPLSVCFKNLTTYGSADGVGVAKTKTLKDAVWRTLTFQDIYEGTLKRIISPEKAENGQPLIHDFSGVVRNGQIMLVLGNPNSGCSTLLRTIANDHESFLGVKGHLDYSGITPSDISKHYRGSVAYIPEDDVHLPTLTVRQTLSFALKNKTPKKALDEVPRFMDEYGRIFGMTHTFDTLVGNSYIRGISGGERKRVSILESLASGSSVNAWDGSTRGLDASSALDYMRSLRIMTDACEKATVVSLYQASDDMYDLVDKVMLIEDGRMLFQGPAKTAEAYFTALGYERKDRQTMSDFLSSVASSSPDNIRRGCEKSVPRGAAALERVFRESDAFKDVQAEIELYDAERNSAQTLQRTGSSSDHSDFDARVQERKSRFVSSGSSYIVPFWRQTLLCLRREWWQLLGHKTPILTRFVCVIVSAFLLGSMFYAMPVNTQGVYSRGSFCFYSAVLVAWFQLAELESSFADRDIIQRHKRFAMVRPSAVVAAKTIMDIPLTVSLVSLYSLIAYFLSGMRIDPGAFFAFDLAIILSAMAFTAFYRLFAAASPRMEIGLRYCGLLILISMIFGGYVRPINRLLSDVPWVGWLAYISPAIYTFEILMDFEFHDRTFDCAPDAIVPSGQGYGDAAYQSCAYTGITPGATYLNGDQYLERQFGFSWSNVGRNFGILLAFTFGCVLITTILVERLSWASGGGATEFAHNSALLKKPATDEESNGDLSSGSKASLELPDGKNDSDSTLNHGAESSKPPFIWRKINYSVQHDGKDKLLLREVSGFGEPGTLTALVGRSGAGKSTLMNVLTQQASGKVTGEIKAGKELVTSSIGRDLGFCQQMDIHIETATVREAFEFSALLRQSRDIPRNEKLSYVEHVLDILGMTELSDAVISSLSLEQRKRTTIGVELCAKPGLALFLDEPTSGLDGQGALSIVKLLRRLAGAGQTIICTIHQANQEQFQLFDRVLALGHGGRPYYFGDIGPRGQAVLDYFSKRGVEAPAGKNVAEFLIEVEAKSAEKGQDWSKEWTESTEAAAILQRIEHFTTKADNSQSSKSGKSTSYAAPATEQVFQLTKRTLVQYWRTPDYIYSRLYCSFFHSLLNGLAFLQLNNDAASIQYRIFSAFLVLMIVPEFINASALMFDENRNVWLGREYPSRIYGWSTFTTAQIIAEIPWALVGAVIFYILFYFLVGFPLGTPAGYTFLMMLMFHLFSTSWGQWTAAFSADAMMAANIMPFLIIVGEFFNGVLQPESLMPAIWRYTFYYISPFTYWIGGILAMTVSEMQIQCTESEFIRFQAPPNMTCGTYAENWLDGAKGYLADPNSTSDCGYCQYSVGQDYLETRNIYPSQAWRNLGIFLLYCITNWLFVYLWVYVKSVKSWLPW